MPDAERIRELDQLAGSPDAFARPAGPAAMADVFQACAGAFGPLRGQMGSRRVFLFTNEDQPHGGDAALQRAAQTQAHDLADLGVSVELFGMGRAGHGPFDPAPFYRDALPPVLDDEEDARMQPAAAPAAHAPDTLAALLAKVRRRERCKRATSRMPLVLGPGVALAVRSYTLFLETRKAAPVWVDALSGRPAEHAAEPAGTAPAYGYDFGGEQAVFTPAELAAVRDLGPPGITVLGFKPRSWLRPEHNLTHSSFLFPDEAATRGSTVAFAALLAGMLELGQVALAAYVARRPAAPRIVALVPQAEQTDAATGAQTAPPGLSMVLLPFADDMRHLHFDRLPEPADPALVSRARAVISRLTVAGGYDPEALSNPVLQRHYALLQALALGQEPAAEDLADKLVPDVATMQRRAGRLLGELAAMLPADTAAPGTAPRKRPPARDLAADDATIEAMRGDPAQLGQLTVPVLRDFVHRKGAAGRAIVPRGSLKADMVRAISEFYGWAG